jgi:hypothetical protein
LYFLTSSKPAYSSLEQKKEVEMRTTTVESADYSEFFQTLPAAKQRVLMLDYDGTVAPFSRDRRKASPYPAVPELLAEIMGTCSTRLIILSGRSARDIPRVLRIDPTATGNLGEPRCGAAISGRPI